MSEPGTDLLAAFGRACALTGEPRAQFLAGLERTDPPVARPLRVLLAADARGDDGLEQGPPGWLVADALEAEARAASEPAPTEVGP